MFRRIPKSDHVCQRQDGWARWVLSALRILPGTVRHQSLRDYVPDPTLGNHLDLVFTVKHQQQRALNRIMRGRLQDGHSMKALGGRTARPYRNGLLVQHALRNGIVQQMHLKEPFGLDQSGLRLAVAAGDEVRIYDASPQKIHVYHNPWFAQLHSVYFSADGKRLLVVATGFDTVLEFDIERETFTMAWNAWDHGYDVSPTGTRVRRRPDSNSGSDCIVVDDPATWNGFGLPTGLTAAHLNNARYRSDDSFMVTLFHHGRALLVDRAGGTPREVLGGLLNPHGFEPGWRGEYVVTDTRRGQVIFFDEAFKVCRVLVIDASEPAEGRAGLGEWLQNVLHLDRGLYGAVDIHRSCIWLFEPETGRRRRVDFSPDWAVQNVIAVDPQRVKDLDRRLDEFDEIHHQVTDPAFLMDVGPTTTRTPAFGAHAWS